MRENLVIAPVGDKSFHRSWAKGSNRSFDIALIYYGKEKNKFREDADYYMENREPGKFQKINAAINQLRNKISAYKYICLPDDDIITSTKRINLLFDKFSEYGLDAGQPSVNHGFIGHLITTTHRDCVLRFGNFVEGMCPVFKSGLLLNEILPTLTINHSSWGVEWVWAEIFAERKVAILDCVGITHKNLKDEVIALISHNWGNYYQEMKHKGISPKKELEEVLAGIKPETKETLFIEKGRISKSLWVRVLLSPLIAADNIKWYIFFKIKRFFQIFNTWVKGILKVDIVKKGAA